MELLVLGGTSFAGRHVVERALADGHRVTVFNRGRTNPDLFPTVRSLHGDRTGGDYRALEGAGPFDAVVDMCAYIPRAVDEALSAIGPDGLAGPYILISSVSAYAEPATNAESPDDPEAERNAEAEPKPEAYGTALWKGFTEDAPLAPLPDGTDPASEEVTGEAYGPLKVLTEDAARRRLPDGVMVIRPGLIVGPHDPTDRFTYWVRRMAEGGEVLAPESPEIAETQVVDAADLAEWIVASADTGRTGTYNAVAPAVPLARALDAALAAAGPEPADTEIVWVPWAFLETQGVAPWADLPAWVPAPMAPVLAADGSRAAAAGLRSRPIEAVVADLWNWDQARPQEPLRAGMSRDREAELLRRFRRAAPPPGP
ncbi:MAG TPA: NAD-dependent epimerase/dehydratase family protein [Acidimicrobiia bacterium]|nr:NAD-dependent epimerase/dehydratase family protein [Acidimicrobiia bacterium]